MKIWLRLHGFEFCSWTIVFDALKVAFANVGCEVYTHSPPEETEDCVEFWWGDPQYFHWSKFPVKVRVALALSEARSIFARGRKKVIANLRKSDLIICPSEFAATAFREAPIDRPIKVSSFGVDVAEFPFVERDWSGGLVFLHAGVTQFRKGSWMVPEAFIKTFGKKDKVRLIMASPKSSAMYTKLAGEYGRCPNIEFRTGIFDSSMELYAESHVYVSPHLSEGFGLCPLEAMGTGMPSLLARCSAPIEYFHKDYGRWIEMSETYVPVSTCLSDTNGFWRLPDLESLVTAMRVSYRDKAGFEEKGRAASEFVHSCMSWESTALSIVSHIEEMMDEEDFGGTAGIQ